MVGLLLKAVAGQSKLAGKKLDLGLLESEALTLQGQEQRRPHLLHPWWSEWDTCALDIFST